MSAVSSFLTIPCFLYSHQDGSHIFNPVDTILMICNYILNINRKKSPIITKTNWLLVSKAIEIKIEAI